MLKTLKAKLIFFAIIASTLPFIVFGVTKYYNTHIESVQNEREDINNVVKQLQKSRVAEKAYLQFYEQEYSTQLDAACKEADRFLNTLRKTDPSMAKQLSDKLALYKTTFTKVIDLHTKSEVAQKTMIDTVEQSMNKLEEVTQSLKNEEFDLVLEGEALKPTEASLKATCIEAKLVSMLLIQKGQELYLSGNIQCADEFDTFMEKFGQSVVSGIDHFANEVGNKEYIEKIKPYKPSVLKSKELLLKSIDLFKKERETVKDLDIIGNDILKLGGTSLASATTTADNAKARSDMMVILLTAIGIAVFCVIAWLIVRAIVKPINETTEVLRDIAQGEGDLTRRLSVKNQDEIGQMSAFFNEFTEKLQGIIRKTSDCSKSIADDMGQVSDSVNKMSDNAANMRDKSHDAIMSSDQISNSMTSISDASQEMTQIINSASAAVEEMTVSISEVAKNADHAAQITGRASKLAQSSNDEISVLSQSAEKIEQAIEMIQDIAEQTNLLALNATIEAARAGEAGKGFAVVASEVKGLAGQTGNATEEISRMVEEIQKSTNNAMSSIRDTSQAIAEVNDVSSVIATSVEQQSLAAQEISENMCRTAQSTQSVTTDLANTTDSIQAMNENIQIASTAAQETNNEVVQIQKDIQSLVAMAGDLQELMLHFKIE